MFPVRDTIPSRTVPVVTWLIIIVNILVFIFELTLSGTQLNNFFMLFGFVPARYSGSPWAAIHGLPYGHWPILTSVFMHGGWLHLILNMWMLWIFGDNVEDGMGHFKFLIFYILCGVLAGLIHFATNPNSLAPTVGASGAIAGVMGAYILLFPYAKIVTMVPFFFYPVFLEIPAVFFLGLWFFSQVLSGFASIGNSSQVGGIAWWAHIGGFIAGGVLRFVFIRSHKNMPS